MTRQQKRIYDFMAIIGRFAPDRCRVLFLYAKELFAAVYFLASASFSSAASYCSVVIVSTSGVLSGPDRGRWRGGRCGNSPPTRFWRKAKASARCFAFTTTTICD
jgi:hypothetical protein